MFSSCHLSFSQQRCSIAPSDQQKGQHPEWRGESIAPSPNPLLAGCSISQRNLWSPLEPAAIGRAVVIFRCLQFWLRSWCFWQVAWSSFATLVSVQAWKDKTQNTTMQMLLFGSSTTEKAPTLVPETAGVHKIPKTADSLPRCGTGCQPWSAWPWPTIWCQIGFEQTFWSQLLHRQSVQSTNTCLKRIHDTRSLCLVITVVVRVSELTLALHTPPKTVRAQRDGKNKLNMDVCLGHDASSRAITNLNLFFASCREVFQGRVFCTSATSCCLCCTLWVLNTSFYALPILWLLKRHWIETQETVFLAGCFTCFLEECNCIFQFCQ